MVLSRTANKFKACDRARSRNQVELMLHFPLRRIDTFKLGVAVGLVCLKSWSFQSFFPLIMLSSTGNEPSSNCSQSLSSPKVKPFLLFGHAQFCIGKKWAFIGTLEVLVLLWSAKVRALSSLLKARKFQKIQHMPIESLTSSGSIAREARLSIISLRLQS